MLKPAGETGRVEYNGISCKVRVGYTYDMIFVYELDVSFHFS